MTRNQHSGSETLWARTTLFYGLTLPLVPLTLRLQTESG